MGAPQEDGVGDNDKAVAPATDTVTTETATPVPAAPVEAKPETETAPPANA